MNKTTTISPQFGNTWNSAYKAILMGHKCHGKYGIHDAFHLKDGLVKLLDVFFNQYILLGLRHAFNAVEFIFP